MFTRCIVHQGYRQLDGINRLKLNPDKTQFIVLVSRQQLAKVNSDSIHLGNADIPYSLKVNCLGLILDAELTMV